MEAGKRDYRREYSGTSYVEGNTVRKLNNIPERREEQYEVITPRRRNERQTKSISSINIPSLLVLTAAVLATLFLCVDYIKAQSDLHRMENDISSKQTKLELLTKNNDAAYESLIAACDLDYIYRVAVEEYGMVYPKDNKVITYQSSDEDSVRKYEDIPK